MTIMEKKMSEDKIHIAATRIYRDGKWYVDEEAYKKEMGEDYKVYRETHPDSHLKDEDKHIKKESTMTYDDEEELHRATDDMPDHSILDRDDSETLHRREEHIFEGREAEDIQDDSVEIPSKEEPIIDDSVMGKLKASVDIPEEFKFADSNTFYTMLRNIFRGKYILVTGPSGCGKSSLGKILADISHKPFHQFNFGDSMNPSAKLLGDTKYNKDDGTWFKPSRFVSALQDDKGSFIMLDEVTRDRTGDLANILMPVLDGQRYLALDESDDSDIVTLDKGAFFYATANIGREYLGATHDLDRAWKDRFTGGIYELEYLPQKKEQELIQIRIPNVNEDDARRITEFAQKIRDLYKAEELNVAVSTRMCLATAELVVDGMELIDALKHTCLPFYPITAGDDTERVKVIQAIQSLGE